MSEYKPLLKNFLDGEGKLKQFPAKRKMKIIALFYLASFFETGRQYTEQEVNLLLYQHHTFFDPATLRRELFDFHFLDRSADGRVYTLAQPQPVMESFSL